MNGIMFFAVTDLSLGRMISLMSLPSFLFVFVCTILFGLVLLPVLRRMNVGQEVREDGPKMHFCKSGTPTFGGLMFLIPILIFGILFPMFDVFNSFLTVEKFISPITVLAVFTFLIGMVGFIDDFIKVRVNKGGLSATVKSILLLVVIIAFTIYYLFFSGIKPFFLIPFTDLSLGGVPFEVSGAGKLVYGAIIVFVLYVTSNSVNITDGVDGLASSVTFISAFTLGVMGASLSSVDSLFASFFSFAIAGGCLAFFFFNRHPAKLFMGDTGSQALGAALAACAVFMGIFWIIILIGMVYVLESLSVLIQVTYYKRTRKRVFRMAPLHHHFELGGWSEWKVVFVFCLITAVGCGLGLWMIL
jgi:phospho-N-acetylmuramoyl-pentapeptide-transferase